MKKIGAVLNALNLLMWRSGRPAPVLVLLGVVALVRGLAFGWPRDLAQALVWLEGVAITSTLCFVLLLVLVMAEAKWGRGRRL